MIKIKDIPLLDGGCSSVGRASVCGTEGRQFNPGHSPMSSCNGVLL